MLLTNMTKKSFTYCRYTRGVYKIKILLFIGNQEICWPRLDPEVNLHHLFVRFTILTKLNPKKSHVQHLFTYKFKHLR